MDINYIALGTAALIPLILGAIWYHHNVFGKVWMREADMTEEKIRNANMPLILGLTVFLSLLLALALYTIVIHQSHLYSILINEPALNNPDSELSIWIQDFMTRYGQNFRTFRHGAFHGLLASILLAAPIIGINTLFERRNYKYFLVNWGFWALCMIAMGGIICAYA